LCVPWISSNPNDFRFRRCGFRFGSSNIRVLTLKMVAALVRGFSGVLDFPFVYYNKLSSMTSFAWPRRWRASVTTCLRLVLVHVIVARWLIDF
jgi:hypothetical protein